MEVWEMDEQQKQQRIEELSLAIDNLLNAKRHTQSAMNDIMDICEAEDLIGYYEQDLTEIDHILDKLNSELEEIIEYEPYDEYNERQREYRKMQGF